MSHELAVAPSAKHDIAEADAYYARFGKADEFLAAIELAFEQVAQRPLMFPIERDVLGHEEIARASQNGRVVTALEVGRMQITSPSWSKFGGDGAASAPSL